MVERVAQVAATRAVGKALVEQDWATGVALEMALDLEMAT